MPRPRRKKGAAAAGDSSGEMPHKKAATVSSGEEQMVHPGKGLAGAGSGSGSGPGSVSTRGALSGEPRTTDPVKASAVPGSSGGMLHKKAAAAVLNGGAPTMDPDKESAVSDFSGVMRQEMAVAAALIGGGATVDPWKGPAISDYSEGMLQRKDATVASSGGGATIESWKGPAGLDSSEGMLQKKAAVASSAGSAASGALHGNTTAQDCEESATKHRTKKARIISSASIQHEHCCEDDGGIGLSPKVDADTGLSVDMLHEHPAEEADTAKGTQESDSGETVHVIEEDTYVQEAELLIQKMDACGIGESISNEEFNYYLNRLPSAPPWIDLEDTLEDEEIDEQEDRLALYRLRYLKHKFLEQASKEELQDDKLKSLLNKSERDCNHDFLEKEGFFSRFEKDYTLDWFFHPDYLECSSLNDYQRLVLRNYGGTEYSRWSEYHRYLHSYKIEKEYVKYCEELSKKLKWMENYMDTCPQSVKWEYISSRGALQAIKIAATDFHEITATLAYNGFNECKESMSYDLTWFKELDGVYFEIWRRVTRQPMSFKDALEEVYKLDRFPVRQRLMEGALEDDYTRKWMEEEFQTCMSAITSEEKKNGAMELIAEDKAKELIAEAVNKLVDKPKYYEQYIRKKIDIARVVGILSPDD